MQCYSMKNYSWHITTFRRSMRIEFADMYIRPEFIFSMKIEMATEAYILTVNPLRIQLGNLKLTHE
jgi:hypothetical protein